MEKCDRFPSDSFETFLPTCNDVLVLLRIMFSSSLDVTIIPRFRLWRVSHLLSRPSWFFDGFGFLDFDAFFSCCASPFGHGFSNSSVVWYCFVLVEDWPTFWFGIEGLRVVLWWARLLYIFIFYFWNSGCWILINIMNIVNSIDIINQYLQYRQCHQCHK